MMNCKKVYVKLGKAKKMVTATTDVGVIKIFTVALQVPLTFFHKRVFSSTGFCIFRTLGQYHRNFVFFKNIKLIGQSKEIKQKWKGLKHFDICFFVIIAAMAKVLFLERRLGTRLCLQPTLRFF